MKVHTSRVLVPALASLIATFALARPAAATVISGKITVAAADNVASLGSNYQGTITQSLQPDTTSGFFNYTGTTLKTVSSELDEGSNWFLTQPGQSFTGTQPAPILSSPVSIPLGDVYLAVSTYSHLDPGYTAYGWVHLQNTGTSLIQLDSAVAYREQGIVVGSAAAVPEPTSLALLGTATTLLLLRRPRRQPHAARC